MSRKKKKSIGPKSIHSEVNIAIDFLTNWFNQQNMPHNRSLFSVDWFAYTPTGWKCMIFSEKYSNLFFEVTYLNKESEIHCNFFKRYEYLTQCEDDKPVFFKKPSAVTCIEYDYLF